MEDQLTPQRSPEGDGLWLRAAPFRADWPPLDETLEAEFTAPQLRALARQWNIPLKGASRSGYITQIAEAILLRVAHMRDHPESLLDGLPAEQAEFIRRLFTARDHELPIPRTLIAALWAKQPVPVSRADQRTEGRAVSPDRPLAEMLDDLRRRALLFPTHRYIGYRDVYYRWLPLEAAGGNVPLISWPAVSPAHPVRPIPSPMPFLDAFDLFLDAVLSTGVGVRSTLPSHPQANTLFWLRRWEHDREEVERLIRSRPGWAPDPSSGVGVPIWPWLTSEARIRLEHQTGLPPAECDFLFALAASLQLIAAPPAAPSPQGAWLSANLSAVEEWFALSHEQRFLRAWTAWQQYVADPLEAALVFGEGQTPQPPKPLFKVMRAIGARDLGPAELGAEWCSVRRYLSRVLRGLPRGVWIDWPALRRALFDFYPNCAWTFFTPDHWWFADPDSLSRLRFDRADDWMRSVGAMLTAALCGPLHWFGLVEIAEQREACSSNEAGGEARLIAFRLTELADWVFGAQVILRRASMTNGVAKTELTIPPLPPSARPRPRVSAPAVWLDEMTWRLPPAPERADFIAFARKIGEPAEAPFTYRLTPASIEAAVREGITVEEVAAQFKRFGAPAPAPALALYRSIAEHYGRVRVYPSLTVLQLSDDYALPELLANTSLGQAIVCQLSPRAVVIRADKMEQLMHELVERGYTPSVV
ncbi:MAG: helicase-associated domain-containing protein [Anaerolineae bacterium]|nr:helicase-associated domain-containing protein [Thermoflexales bacterium]MDW8407733.1 helicase-associated domain-containing protein [Anaerolineae bacterium]